MFRLRPTLAALSFVVLIGAAGASPASSLNGDIAFTQTFYEVWGVLSMRADGTGVRRLTLEPTSDSWPVSAPDGRRIAFASRRNGQWELYVMRADGTAVRRVTNHPAPDTAPDWSPDGRRLVFVRGRGAAQELYTVAANGGPARRLTRNRRADNDPAWSPNGVAIAFSRSRAKEEYDLWRLDFRTRHQRRLARGRRDDWGPRWSPNGRLLAYTTAISTDAGYLADIAVMRADGTRKRRLTRGKPGLRNMYPTWSPDGRSIAFFSTRGDHGVWVMRRNGTSMRPLRPTQCCRGWDFYDLRWARDRRLLFSHEYEVEDEVLVAVDDKGRRRLLTSDTGEGDRDVSWAPDGRSFVFTRFLGTCCSHDVFLREEDGSERNLNTHPAPDRQPDLSPDGKLIAFATQRGREATLVDIWLMAANGDAPRPLVQDPANDAQPDWAPDGQKVAFTRFARVSDDVEAPPGDIFVTDLGGATRRLTDDPANDEEPRWSPDGTKIVFTSQRDGRFQLYMMSSDGSRQVRLLASRADDREPAWSPDGTRIVFDRFTRNRLEIWSVRVDGTGARRVTTVCATAACVEVADAPSPSWQPRASR